MKEKVKSPLEKVPGTSNVSWVHQDGMTYLLCGEDRDGKKFRMTGHFAYLSRINAWSGRLYLLWQGKRFLIKRIIN
jgi:hypothetical protein